MIVGLAHRPHLEPAKFGLDQAPLPSQLRGVVAGGNVHDDNLCNPGARGWRKGKKIQLLNAQIKLRAFEATENHGSPVIIRVWLCFVVAGEPFWDVLEETKGTPKGTKPLVAFLHIETNPYSHQPFDALFVALESHAKINNRGTTSAKRRKVLRSAAAILNGSVPGGI